jgi:hypothetical protein
MRIATLTATLATAALLAGMMSIGARPHGLISPVAYVPHAAAPSPPRG